MTAETPAPAAGLDLGQWPPFTLPAWLPEVAYPQIVQQFVAAAETIRRAMPSPSLTTDLRDALPNMVARLADDLSYYARFDDELVAIGKELRTIGDARYSPEYAAAHARLEARRQAIVGDLHTLTATWIDSVVEKVRSDLKARTARRRDKHAEAIITLAETSKSISQALDTIEALADRHCGALVALRDFGGGLGRYDPLVAARSVREAVGMLRRAQPPADLQSRLPSDTSKRGSRPRKSEPAQEGATA